MAPKCVAWLAVWAGCFALSAADRPEPRARLRADSDLVLINASVTDRDGHFVGGLGSSSFRLFDGKTEQRIVSLSEEDAPISVGIVFDASGSMESALPVARQALREFAATANPQDEFAAVVVRSRPDWTLEFTRDPQELLDQVAAIPARGATALIDSIYLAAQKMKSAHNARKALLVISDGMDNHSRYRERELARFLREADVTIYVIGVFRAYPEEEANAGRLFLQEAADTTGGRYIQADGPKDIAKAMAQLDVRNQYVIAFSPQGVAPDGRYHRVNLKLVPQSPATGLRASWRRGYYAPDTRFPLH